MRVRGVIVPGGATRVGRLPAGPAAPVTAVSVPGVTRAAVGIDERLVRALLRAQYRTWPIGPCGWGLRAGTTSCGVSGTTSLSGCRGRPRPRTRCW